MRAPYGACEGAQTFSCGMSMFQRRLVPEVRRCRSVLALRNFTSIASPKTLSMLGINISLGQPLQGVDKAPELLRRNGLREVVSECGWRLQQLPDIEEKMFPTPSKEIATLADKANARNNYVMGKNLEGISDVLTPVADQDNFLLMIGGDHSISMGTIPPIVKTRGKTGVVWVDAHADINTPETSPSGNMHGMSLAFLLGEIQLNFM